MRPWLVTGAAGFIGFHLSSALLARGQLVVGLDNINSYYDQQLKRARLDQLQAMDGFVFERLDLRDADGLTEFFPRYHPDVVINLAAQAGVRHSLHHPMSYVDSNLVGFMNVLEQCRHNDVNHLIYASSSSVYGHNAKLPFSVDDPADQPVSIYAATKRANEMMAHAYSHLFALPTTGLRLFTAYGPWGRPDMAYYMFARAILDGEPITIFGDGSAIRDFTYVEDVVEAILRITDRPPGRRGSEAPASEVTSEPWRLYNIGHGEQVSINELIDLLEDRLGRSARRVHLDRISGDVPITSADTSALERDFGYRPSTGIAEGIARFADWFRPYHAERRRGSG